MNNPNMSPQSLQSAMSERDPQPLPKRCVSCKTPLIQNDLVCSECGFKQN
jgi:predicted amidophosphoribosyltransferase